VCRRLHSPLRRPRRRLRCRLRRRCQLLPHQRRRRRLPHPRPRRASRSPRSPSGNLIVAPITPYLLKLGAVPEKTRQTIGWAALVTLFNAGVLWGWVLMQGPPDLAAASTDQPGLVGEDGTAHGAVKGTGKPTAAGHDEHGAKSEAKAAKKDKTKKDEKAAKKDDHGGH
jgi:hypothetical protein